MTQRSPADRPSDDELAALGIVWVDAAGITPTGLPYPASSDPAANGAANIQALAEAIDAQGPRDLGGPATTGGTIGTAGTVAWTQQMTIPAAPVKRLIQAHMMAYVSAIGSAATVFNFRVNGTDVRRVDVATAKESVFAIHTWALPANTSATLQGVGISGGGNATVPADGRFAWINVYSLGGIT
jgi:hypothetical protein